MSTAKILSSDAGEEKNFRKAANDYSLVRSAKAIRELVENAGQCLAPVWPLETFVACNPLQGFETQPFAEALVHGTFAHRNESNPSLEKVNRQMIKWCANFFDAGQSSIALPHRHKGFYQAFIKLAYFDKQLHENNKEAKIFLQNLPESPEDAINICLAKLDVPPPKLKNFLVQTFLYLPGWAGFVKWKTDWQETNNIPVHLTDFMAVRLIITSMLWPNAAKVEKIDTLDSSLKKIWSQLEYNESQYRQNLLNFVLSDINHVEHAQKRRTAQLVFCIDVRSEPLRRAIESLGNYETFGFAGFFGVPIRINTLKDEKTKNCCPVLLKPQYTIKETLLSTDKETLNRYQKGRTFLNSQKNLYVQLKHNVSTPFALVESLGLWCGMSMAIKSLVPGFSKKFKQWLDKGLGQNVPIGLSYDSEENDNSEGLSLQEQIDYAYKILRLMGLTRGFAKLIILCGHGSSTTNNPYASALDCGACGGNHGGINAQLLAAILNKTAVRHGLEDLGIHIPLDSIFYAALHNTTTDEITIYGDTNQLPIYPDLLQKLTDDLHQARTITNEERGRKLGVGNTALDILRRSQDWSETRPEWGLARNAAFIAAPRQLTKSINLDGRCFLHSYCWEEDDEGELLETILTAPMIVAQWINAQYLFSTLDNVSFGSGSKITHNVVGKIGVMQGNGSDLMHGLPLQSVMADDDNSYHELQRLQTIVYAPKERVSRLINKHRILKTLFINEWLHLIVIDPENNLPYRFVNTGDWQLIA